MKNDEGQGGNGKSAEGRVIVSETMVERASLGVLASQQRPPRIGEI